MGSRFVYGACVLLLLSACTVKSSPAPPPTGPHGGELITLGADVAHLEVVRGDQPDGFVIHVLDGKKEPMDIVDTPTIEIPEENGHRAITGAGVGSDGGRSIWSFKDPDLEHAPEGTHFKVVIDGVTYAPDVPHGHSH